MIERPPFLPFNEETAIQKIRMAEDAWNSRDPVKQQYGLDSTGDLEILCTELALGETELRHIMMCTIPGNIRLELIAR